MKKPRPYIVVDVTQDDIDKGCRRWSAGCPIARAFTRALPEHATQVAVTPCTVFWTHDGVRWKVRAPLRVQDFVYKFDTLGPARVKPFSSKVYREWVERA